MYTSSAVEMRSVAELYVSYECIYMYLVDIPDRGTATALFR